MSRVNTALIYRKIFDYSAGYLKNCQVVVILVLLLNPFT